MNSIPLTVVQGKYSNKYVITAPALTPPAPIALAPDSATNIFDSIVFVDGDHGATCPHCHTVHWSTRGELDAWNRAIDCLMRHKEHQFRCPDDIPFDGRPVSYDDSHETGGEQYGLASNGQGSRV